VNQPAAQGNSTKQLLLGCGGVGIVLLIAAGIGLLLWLSPTKNNQDGFSIRAAKDSVVGGAGSAQVSAPAGAVDKDVVVALTPRGPEIPVADGGRLVGRVWNVQVDGRDHYRFHKPVRLALPIDRSLVKRDSAVFLSVHQGSRWQKVPGSRVEGDRVVADIDHFSDYAPTQDDAPAAPDPAAKKSWNDIASWHGELEITTSGTWGGWTPISSYNWVVSRSGSARFRLKGGFPGAPKPQWSTMIGGSAPEDQAGASVQVADGGYRTDDDTDRNGNVFHYSTAIGGGTSSIVSATLEMDPAAGTYKISIRSGRAGSVVCKNWTEGGKAQTPYEESAELSFLSGPLPLPGTIGPLTGSITDEASKVPARVRGEQLGGAAVRTSVTWTLSPGPPSLKARIHSLLLVRRGEGITMDGSASTGDIAAYRWTFQVAKGCPKAPGEAPEHADSSTRFTALWDFHAQLTVTDRSGKTDVDERDIRVVAREGFDWEMLFTGVRPSPKPLTSSLRAGSPDWLGTMHLGINLCARDGDVDSSGHRIHRKTSNPDRSTWVDVGYEVIRVGDDGPFGGLWFVLKQSLQVERTERVNRSLMPGGEVYQLNVEKMNPAPEQQLLRQVTDHEHGHTQLMKEEFDRVRAEKADPAPAIEKEISASKPDLIEAADKVILPVEVRLTEAGSESNVKARLAKKYPQSVSVWFYQKVRRPEDVDLLKVDESRLVDQPILRPMGRLSELGDDHQDR